jgi:hypothetical protein
MNIENLMKGALKCKQFRREFNYGNTINSWLYQFPKNKAGNSQLLSLFLHNSQIKE